LEWTHISPEVKRLNGEYVLPFVKGSEGPVHAVDMFGTPDHYTSLTLELAVKKGWLGVYPIWSYPFLLDEFAVFICNDWTIWRGQEFGIRFPMHLGKNWCTVYAQHPWGSFLWFDVPIYVPNVEDVHGYNLEIRRFDDCVQAIFRIDGKPKFWFRGKNFNLPFLPVLCAHTRYGEDFGYTMRLKSIRWSVDRSR